MLDDVLFEDETAADDDDALFGEGISPAEDPTLLPARRVTPEQSVKQGLQARGGSRLNRWAGSFLQSIYEGARMLRPIGVRGLSRQDTGVAGLLAQFLGQSENLPNVKSTDGRQLSYAPGTPEWEVAQRLLNAMNRGESIVGFVKTPEMRAYLKKHKLGVQAGVNFLENTESPIELFPGIGDAVQPFAEGVGAGVNRLFGTQLFGNTENWNAMYAEMAEKFQVWTPRGTRAVYDGVRYRSRAGSRGRGDAGDAQGQGSRAEWSGGRMLQAERQSRTGWRARGQNSMRVDTVLNEGFRVPFTPKTRPRTRWGLSEVFDPEEWGARASVGLVERGATRVLSPHAASLSRRFGIA